MNTKKLGTGCYAVGIFSAGLLVGNWLTVHNVRKKASTMQPLIVNALVSIYEKVMEGDITENELREYATVEMNFIQIALGVKNDGKQSSSG